MFTSHNIARVATAAVGALVLSTLSVAAAVGPSTSLGTGPGDMAETGLTAYAPVPTDRAHG